MFRNIPEAGGYNILLQSTSAGQLKGLNTCYLVGGCSQYDIRSSCLVSGPSFPHLFFVIREEGRCHRIPTVTIDHVDKDNDKSDTSK